jgi:hypothetical protein
MTKEHEGDLMPEQDKRRERIALAAYHIAERRGFQAGNEQDDWLAAEKQVDDELAREAAAAYRPINLNVREEIRGRERPSPLDAGLPDEPDERPARRSFPAPARARERRAMPRGRPLPPKLAGEAA